MRYKRFIIKNYRAITGPLDIPVDKGSLMPIIGVNESGKTTILHAIFAFDHFNDDANDGGRHLKDVSNLYRTSSPPAIVKAEIEISPSGFKEILHDFAASVPKYKEILERFSRRKHLPETLSIQRNINTKNYSILTADFGDAELQDVLAREIIRFLPYILYFDDFRDKVAERIEIPENEEISTGQWFDIFQQLFKQTDDTFSLCDIPNMEVRRRKTVLSKVQRHLNNTLTRAWQTFRLDDRDALRINIEFEQKEAPQKKTDKAHMPGATSNTLAGIIAHNTSNTSYLKNYLRIEVVETDENGDEHFFFISDRSKGFYWFFNFVMKLQFNPKVNSDSANSIYLLDEPGSYLHAHAQRKLCLKLKQIAERNDVLYCTHSHYLLDPEVIPLNRIMVADKDGNGRITLNRMIDHQAGGTQNRFALQPLLDALQIKPYALDLVHTQATIITEGIYDYFCLELFRKERPVSILPSVGADSIKYYISLMIAWQIDFRALWDNDSEGRKHHGKAADLFGPEVAARHFRLLPAKSNDSPWIIQNLFDGSDLTEIRTVLGIAQNCSFEKTILALFYSQEKDTILQGISKATSQRFDDLYTSLGIKLQESKSPEGI